VLRVFENRVLRVFENRVLRVFENRVLRVFENTCTVLREIFGPKREGLRGDYRQLYSDALHDCTSRKILFRD
jgi:hypothetical protein